MLAPAVSEAFAGEFQQRHAAILARGVLQREQRRAVAVQQRVRHRVAAGDRLVAAAERDRDMGEGPGLVGLRGDLIEDQAAGLVDADAALDQVLGEAALEVQLVGEIVDRGDALALLRAGLGHQRVGVDAARPVPGRRIGRGFRLGCGRRVLCGCCLVSADFVSVILVRGRVGRVARLVSVGLIGVVIRLVLAEFGAAWR